MNRDLRQVRTSLSEFETRKDGETPHISGYFSVFNSNYEIFKGCTESIAPGAFTDELHSDVRALVDHDTRLVLGRTTAGTLELREDKKGLWGDIAVNPKDSEAMNCWARVERGDVSQCSIGFNILDEEHEEREDGTHHFTIRKVKLFEVSVCTFPAYEDTAISARKADIEEIEKRKADIWREEARKKLKEVSYGTESVNA
jgi:HK97 family phage prohead protease